MRASQYKKRMDKKTLYITIGSVVGVLLISVFIFFMSFRVTEVEVVGNTRYTDKEVEKMALTGPFSFNSLLVVWQNGHQEVTDIPFIESFELERINRHKIRIHVKEKQPVGYVEADGQKLYFDKDGLVVETSVDSDSDAEVVKPVQGESSQEEDKTEYHAAVTDVPLIEGLEFSSAVVGEKLQVENDEIFNTIMGITRMVDKFEVIPDKVVFDEEYNATLYYGNVRVLLGQDTLLEEKIARVAAILPKLTAESGELHLEDFEAGTTQIIFSRDNAPTAEAGENQVVIQGTNDLEGNGMDTTGGSEEGSSEGNG